MNSQTVRVVLRQLNNRPAFKLMLPYLLTWNVYQTNIIPMQSCYRHCVEFSRFVECSSWRWSHHNPIFFSRKPRPNLW